MARIFPLRVTLCALLFAAPLLPACGPASCSDACLDRCDEKPDACEPNGTLFCQQACPDGDAPESGAR